MSEIIHECRSSAAKFLGCSIQTISTNPKYVLYGVFAVSMTVWLLVRAMKCLKQSTITQPSTPTLEKGAFRTFKTAPREPGGQQSCSESPRTADHYSLGATEV